MPTCLVHNCETSWRPFIFSFVIILVSWSNSLWFLLISQVSPSHSVTVGVAFGLSCQGRNPEKRKWKIIERSYTPFRSNVQRRRRIYLAMIERRLQWRVKDVGAESDLLNDLGFNLCVAPWSPVVRLVAYFGVREVAKTEVLRSRSGQGEIRTRWL